MSPLLLGHAISHEPLEKHLVTLVALTRAGFPDMLLVEYLR